MSILAVFSLSASGHKTCIRKLLEHGADVNVQSASGSTPLHLAVINKHEECVVVLLDHGASTSITDTTGNSPLDIAESTEEENLINLFDSEKRKLVKEIKRVVDLNSKLEGKVAEVEKVNERTQSLISSIYRELEDVKRNLRNSERSRYEAEQVSQLLKKQLDDATEQKKLLAEEVARLKSEQEKIMSAHNELIEKHQHLVEKNSLTRAGETGESENSEQLQLNLRTLEQSLTTCQAAISITRAQVQRCINPR